MSKTVILLDDEVEICTTIGKILERKLKKHDVKVEVFTESPKAFEYIKDKGQDVDVLITDVKMPEMNGLDLIKEIRSLGLRFRIMAITGATDRDEQEVDLLIAESDAMLEDGFKATRILPKPIDALWLCKEVKSILGLE